MFGVDISGTSPARFGLALPVARYEPFEPFERAMGEGGHILSGRVVWNVNSTARGAGVAELLASLVPCSRGARADQPAGPDWRAPSRQRAGNLALSPGDFGHALGEAADKRQAGRA
jgi:trehalose synthase